MTSSDKRGIAWSVKNMAVRIPAGDVVLDADLTIEPDAKAIIVFAHGSGSGRYSPRDLSSADCCRVKNS